MTARTLDGSVWSQGGREEVVQLPLLARDGRVRAYAQIDAADLPLIGEGRWHLAANGYAVRNVNSRTGWRVQRLHRLILGVEDTRQFVDHINRDKLDNRRSNLRIVTRAENGYNQGANRGSTSEHRGVSWKPRLSKWVAQAQRDGVKYHLGLFTSESDAARAVEAFWAPVMPS